MEVIIAISVVAFVFALVALIVAARASDRSGMAEYGTEVARDNNRTTQRELQKVKTELTEQLEAEADANDDLFAAIASYLKVDIEHEPERVVLKQRK